VKDTRIGAGQRRGRLPSTFLRGREVHGHRVRERCCSGPAGGGGGGGWHIEVEDIMDRLQRRVEQESLQVGAREPFGRFTDLGEVDIGREAHVLGLGKQDIGTIGRVGHWTTECLVQAARAQKGWVD